jgi:hypothetical protein
MKADMANGMLGSDPYIGIRDNQEGRDVSCAGVQHFTPRKFLGTQFC